jgi:hypothetical protein
MFVSLPPSIRAACAILVSTVTVSASASAQSARRFEATAGAFAGQSNFGFDVRDWHKMLGLRTTQSFSIIELEESLVHVFGCGDQGCTWDPATYVTVGLHLSVPVTTSFRPYAGGSIGGSSRPGIASFTRSWDIGARYVFNNQFGVQADIRRRRETVFDEPGNPFNASTEISLGFIKRFQF